MYWCFQEPTPKKARRGAQAVKKQEVVEKVSTPKPTPRRGKKKLASPSPVKAQPKGSSSLICTQYKIYH